MRSASEEMEMEMGIAAPGSGCSREWSDLPNELLACIVDRLGLIEHLCFRGVCKSWNAATSTASAHTESQPWFLIYGGDETTLLFADSGRKYSISSSSLPELEGATCLASNHGWLLLYRESSIFFFCPFSRALIHLPALISRPHRAAAQFSSPPTSPDCAVCVVVRGPTPEHNNNKVYWTRRGTDTWTEHELPGHISKIEYTLYNNKGAFVFVDERRAGFSYEAEGGGRIRWFKGLAGKNDAVFKIANKSENDGRKEKLGILNDFEGFELSSVCGTLVPIEHTGTIRLIPYQNFGDDDEDSDSQSRHRRRRKGVWLHPRFHLIHPTQTW